MGIAAGTYDRRVTISAATPIQSTATGQMVVAWVAVLTNIPARIKYDSGSQQYQAEQRVSTQTVTFEIRYANGIKPGQRVECEGKFYNIQYVAELGRRVALQLSCEQKDNETTQAAGIPPSNVVAPTIAPSGTQQTGTVLTVSAGTWAGTTPITYNYRWTRNGTPITGATAATYTIQVADDAATIRCEVQATNAFGSSAFVASSNSATGVNATAPVNTVAPVVSGNPVVGQTLSTTNGTWSGIPAPTYTYQWQRNGSNITGATSQTYVLQQADAGNSIRCVVTATNTAGSASANSNTISQITDADASAFIAAITAAGGTTNDAQKTAINNLVLNWKGIGAQNSSYNLWSNTERLHIYIGGASGAMAINVKTATATFTFNGGWTFDANGATPNGTNGYINTGVNTSTINPQLSNGICRIVGFNTNATNFGGDGYLFGADTYFYIGYKSPGNDLVFRNYNSVEANVSQSGVDTRNIYQQKLKGLTGTVRRAKSQVSSQSPNQTPTTSGSEFLSTINIFGTPSSSYDTRQRNFDALILGLDVTDTISNVIVDIINQYQTDLGRNNYQP